MWDNKGAPLCWSGGRGHAFVGGNSGQVACSAGAGQGGRGKLCMEGREEGLGLQQPLGILCRHGGQEEAQRLVRRRRRPRPGSTPPAPRREGVGSTGQRHAGDARRRPVRGCANAVPCGPAQWQLPFDAVTAHPLEDDAPLLVGDAGSCGGGDGVARRGAPVGLSCMAACPHTVGLGVPSAVLQGSDESAACCTAAAESTQLCGSAAAVAATCLLAQRCRRERRGGTGSPAGAGADCTLCGCHALATSSSASQAEEEAAPVILRQQPPAVAARRRPMPCRAAWPPRWRAAGWAASGERLAAQPEGAKAAHGCHWCCWIASTAAMGGGCTCACTRGASKIFIARTSERAAATPPASRRLSQLPGAAAECRAAGSSPGAQRAAGASLHSARRRRTPAAPPAFLACPHLFRRAACIVPNGDSSRVCSGELPLVVSRVCAAGVRGAGGRGLGRDTAGCCKRRSGGPVVQMSPSEKGERLLSCEVHAAALGGSRVD